MRRPAPVLALVSLSVLAVALPACGGEDEGLTIYSGREQELVQPLLERFAEEEDVQIRVRYGDTAELAATILEEGDNSPADVFFAQDGGALGAIDAEGRLRALPQRLLDRVPPEYRAPDGTWVGFSGRARVVAYSTERVDEGELPDSILGFTDPRWRGRIGWAPTNGSFQSFVTALRLLEGDEAARTWLEDIVANEPVEYSSNLTAEDGIADGEVDIAFVNHYYNFVLKEEEGEDYPVENHFIGEQDPGALVNVAGAGILDTADDLPDAEGFVDFMLSSEAQEYFATETFEYPLIEGVPAPAGLPPIDELDAPQVNLGDLDDLEGTLQMLQEVGALP